MSLRCEILSTGDEVLTGMIADTNAAFLADQMASLGFDVVRHTTVGDDRTMLAMAFRELGASADVVLCTGGLGPTVDDLTTEVAAEVVGSGLKLDEAALARMEGLWRSRGREMPPNNRKQALLPEPSEVLENPIGTAPGFAMRLARATFFFMPGVPREMKRMFAEQVIPRLQALRSAPTVFEVRVFRSFGLTESAADRALADFAALYPDVKVGFRAHFPEIQVKLTVKGDGEVAARANVAAAAAEVSRRLGPNLFSEGPAMEAVVGEALRAAGATLAIAESCTGGLVAQLVTGVPGSSDYFDRGFVTYSNASKVDLLGVTQALLDAHGAVSDECARAMAEGARARAGTTHALATTGIAGPGGGSAAKPVGTVFIALASPDGTAVRKLAWPGEREQVRLISAMVALDLLRRKLAGLPLEGSHELGARPRG